MLNKSILVVVALGLCASGCGRMAAERAVTETARQDHNCPPEQINIVRKHDEGWAYDIEVCGRVRTYADATPDDKQWQFEETGRRRRQGPADTVMPEDDGMAGGEPGSLAGEEIVKEEEADEGQEEALGEL